MCGVNLLGNLRGNSNAQDYWFVCYTFAWVQNSSTTFITAIWRHIFMSCDMLRIFAMSHMRDVLTESIEYDNCNALYVMGSLIQRKYYKHNGSLYWVPDHLQSPLQFDIHRNCKDIDNNSCKEVNNIREYAWKQIYEYIVGVNLVPEQHIYTQNLLEKIISTLEYTVITTCTMMVRSFYHSTYIDIRFCMWIFCCNNIHVRLLCTYSVLRTIANQA